LREWNQQQKLKKPLGWQRRLKITHMGVESTTAAGEIHAGKLKKTKNI